MVTTSNDEEPFLASKKMDKEKLKTPKSYSCTEPKIYFIFLLNVLILEERLFQRSLFLSSV